MKCRRCEWWKNPKNINCKSFVGNPNAEIIFCMEDLTPESEETFNKLLEHAKINKNDIAIINPLRCWIPTNAIPTKSQLNACFIYSYKDLQQIQPKLVVAMGDSACYQYLGKEGVGVHRKKLFMSEKTGFKTMVTYHPASILYDKADKGPKLLEDFKNIKEFIDREPFEYKTYPYKVVSSPNELRELVEHLKGKAIFFDVETTGLDLIKDNQTSFFNTASQLTQIQIGVSEKEIYLIEADLIPYCVMYLKPLADTCLFRGQGFSFDAKAFFYKLGLEIKHWDFDTCLAEYILEGMKDNDLTYLTGKYVPEAYGYDAKVKALGGAHKVTDKDELRQYGANDIGVLFPIYRSQFKQLVQNKQLWLFQNITMPCNKVLTKMSLRGVLYDTKEIMKVDKKYEIMAEEAFTKALSLKSVQTCQEHFQKSFNPRSPQMVQWLLLDYYKLPVLKTTKPTKANPDGNPSIGKDEMKKYAIDHKNEYCDLMQLYRSYQNIRDNFLSGVLPKLVKNVAHTTYSLHATTTGRPNSKNPNILNIPADDEDIKRCIIARPGHIFLYSDLSQIEVKVASVIYHDKALIELCNTVGKDFHCMTTAKVFKIPYEEVNSKYLAYEDGDHSPENAKIAQARRAAKAIVFGIFYQMGAEKLSKTLGVSLLKAEQFIKEFFAGFPDLEKEIEKTKQFVLDNGYVDTYFNFRRKWKNHSIEDHATLREAVNARIQGTA